MQGLRGAGRHDKESGQNCGNQVVMDQTLLSMNPHGNCQPPRAVCDDWTFQQRMILNKFMTTWVGLFLLAVGPLQHASGQVSDPPDGVSRAQAAAPSPG